MDRLYDASILNQTTCSMTAFNAWKKDEHVCSAHFVFVL